MTQMYYMNRLYIRQDDMFQYIVTQAIVLLPRPEIHHVRFATCSTRSTTTWQVPIQIQNM